MPAPMSLDLRLRIVHAVERGSSRSAKPRDTLYRQPIGGDQADATSARDGKSCAGALWRPSPTAARAACERSAPAGPGHVRTSRWLSSRRNSSAASGS